MSLRDTMLDVQDHLVEIEKICGPNYKLTLIARNVGRPDLKDADIIMTLDDLDAVKASIDKMKDREPTFKAGGR